MIAVERALEQVDMTAFRHESWQGLSGGERQRVQIARQMDLDYKKQLAKTLAGVNGEDEAAAKPASKLS